MLDLSIADWRQVVVGLNVDFGWRASLPKRRSNSALILSPTLAVCWRYRERRLLAGTEEKVHLSGQIVGLLERSQPARAIHKNAAVGKVLPILDVSDQVKGHNLPGFAEKRGHVMASVMNGLSNLTEVLGAPIVKSLERVLDRQCFMLGALQEVNVKLPGGVIKELLRMVGFFEKAIQPPPQPQATPVYDTTGLLFAVQAAAGDFQRPWAARLGITSYNSIAREHWTRIRALNRRIAGELNDEYDTLRPVADLVARLTERISVFLDNPVRWTRDPVDDEEAQAAISGIRREVFATLHKFIADRLVEKHLPDWRAAFSYSGRGSTFDRARDIRDIYEAAAPVPGVVVTQVSVQFLKEIRSIVHRAVEDNGGQLELASVA
jgi:hypothetical protein